jgi:hypothetical protein
VDVDEVDREVGNGGVDLDLLGFDRRLVAGVVG